MRMVLNVAKAELRNLFYSPVAWFLAIAFLVQCAFYFTNSMHFGANMQDAMIEQKPDFKDFGPMPFTFLFFMSDNSIYPVVLKNMYLFVPLLCMGLMSREVNTGTIKLLYSSPVKLRKVVLGKYLAIVLYNLLLVGIVGIFLVSMIFSVRSADYGLMLSGALGFFLLTCAYTAIGLFMSSLSSYQVISAIGTFIVIFILSRIGYWWQEVDIVRDITNFLFLSGRTERMLRGLISSRDVIYYLMVIFMFLSFTVIRLRSSREAKPWYVQVMRIITVIVIALTIGYLSAFPRLSFYLDGTALNLNTIHENTQKIVHEMDEPLEVTLYTNLLGGESTYGFKRARNSYVATLWEQYQRFKPDITFRYIDYYYHDRNIDGASEMFMKFPGKTNDEMAREMAKGHKVNLSDFIQPDSITKMEDLGPEGHRLVMKLTYKGRTEWLRTYQTPRPFPHDKEFVWPKEQNVAAVLKRLVHPESIPRIAFTSGNLERNIYKAGEREYWNANINKSIWCAPINLGFDIDTVSLEQQDIPAGITALVVADPKTALSAVSQQKIREYIDKGGNAIFIGEPGKQKILNPLLKQIGVEMLDGNIVQPTYHEQPDKVMALYSNTSLELAEEKPLLAEKYYRATGYHYDTARVMMPGVTALSFSDTNGFKVQPVLENQAATSWLKKGRLVTDSAAILFNEKDGDRRGSFPTALQLSRQLGSKEQRIVVYSDADYCSNYRVMNGETVNRAVYHWMSGEFPVYQTRPAAKDNRLTITGKDAKRMKFVYLWVLPALLLILGTVLLIRRKRK